MNANFSIANRKILLFGIEPAGGFCVMGDFLMVTFGYMPVNEVVALDKGLDVWHNFGTKYVLECRKIGIIKRIPMLEMNAAFICAKAVLPGMIAKGGLKLKVVNSLYCCVSLACPIFYMCPCFLRWKGKIQILVAMRKIIVEKCTNKVLTIWTCGGNICKSFAGLKSSKRTSQVTEPKAKARGTAKLETGAGGCVVPVTRNSERRKEIAGSWVPESEGRHGNRPDGRGEGRGI